MGTIHIAGAGLGGMVAAMNLARSGHEVHVLDAAGELGGIGDFHPSLHVTPIDRTWMSRFIGCDITEQFVPTQECRFWIKEDPYQINYPVLCSVERGDRPSSLDRQLYKQCIELGVTFHFGQRVRRPSDLPPGSIFACGLHTDMYRALGIPYEKIYGSYLAMEMEPERLDRSSLIYFDTYTKDYFYAAGTHRLWYGLLFGREPLTETDRARCREHLEGREGVRLKEWRHITGCVPTGTITNPRLLLGKYILAGSMSGMMDPFFLFGIHGALLSGKVAALAVDRPEEALHLFRDLNRHYWKSFIVRKGFERFPYGYFLFRNMISKQRLFLPLLLLLGQAVPGGPKGWFREATRTVTPLSSAV